MMRNVNKALLIVFICLLTACSNQFFSGNAYYISTSGNDAADGSQAHPWRTIGKLNAMPLQAGDKICFAGGEIFEGTLNIDSLKEGTGSKPVMITSYGTGNAIIFSRDTVGLSAQNVSNLVISKLTFKGSGRKDGNKTKGIIISNSENIKLDSIDVSGYQKAGVHVGPCDNVVLEHIYAHDNGFAGISVEGNHEIHNSHNIIIRDCVADNNPGDPSNLVNHSGNGIVVGYAKNVLIEYCAATNNGWDMPRIGNGPVGIWACESDSVVIQHCISYRNKTSKGGADGGGYDFDGGITNSVIQYCLSYENAGYGYAFLQYYEGGDWHDNTVRYCISVNDGLADPHASFHIWNAQGDAKKFKDGLVYNNTFYNEKGAAISYHELNKNGGIRFFNNLFVVKDTMILGKVFNGSFIGNNWYSFKKLNIAGYSSLNEWATKNKQEQFENHFAGVNMLPEFKNVRAVNLTDPRNLAGYVDFAVADTSQLYNAGVDIQKAFGINIGEKDFNGNSTHAKEMGASFFNAK